MSEQKHTPGEWVQLANVSGMGLSIRIHSDRGLRLIASVGTHDVNVSNGKDGIYHDFKDHHEIEANARLIAAAPDMALVLAGVACGAIRAEPGTRELAFDGLRYSLGRNPDWKRVVGIMGRDRLAAAIRKAGGVA